MKDLYEKIFNDYTSKEKITEWRCKELIDIAIRRVLERIVKDNGKKMN